MRHRHSSYGEARNRLLLLDLPLKLNITFLQDTTTKLLWLRWLLQHLGVDYSTTTPIYCDNWSAIQIAHNDVFHERTKYIEIDYYFTRHIYSIAPYTCNQFLPKINLLTYSLTLLHQDDFVLWLPNLSWHRITQYECERGC